MWKQKYKNEIEEYWHENGASIRGVFTLERLSTDSQPAVVFGGSAVGVEVVEPRRVESQSELLEIGVRLESGLGWEMRVNRKWVK